MRVCFFFFFARRASGAKTTAGPPEVSALVPLRVRLHRGLRAEAEGEVVGLSSLRLWLAAGG